jgi:hypothetical protein
MATITLTTTAIKPADKQWFNVAESTKNTAYIAWARSFPGVTSFTGSAVDTNTWRTQMVFENQASYDTWQVSRLLNEHWLARKDYNTANGITASTVVA